MTCFRGVDRRHKRFFITHFTHENDIGVLSYGVLHCNFKIFHILSNFPLVDEAFVLLIDELDGVFDRDDVRVPGAVDVVDERRQGGALAAACCPRDQHQSTVGFGEARHRARQPKVTEAEISRRDQAGDDAQPALLPGDVQTVAAPLVGQAGVEVTRQVELVARGSLERQAQEIITKYDTDKSGVLEFDEFRECIARCALDKYKPIRQMSPAVMITSFCKNLLGEENTEECMNTATLIKAERYNWKRYSQTLPGQSLKEHKKWLEVWQRLELTDMYYFPLWEKGVHDVMQKNFAELSLIFLAYCRSLLGSDTAEDAMEMEMAEFKDFVDECGLETKAINFDLMTNNFIKANATNSAQVRDQHAESRRSAATKMDQRTTAEVSKVKGTSDGQEAKKDQELVLYEFIALLVRIAFQRANPTFGNFGNKKAVVHLPGCLQSMLVDEILPRARKDTSAAFRETVMEDKSVKTVIEEYQDRIHQWYKKQTADDTKQTTITDKLQMDQWMRICDEKDLVGIWECYRESDITGDPATKKKYAWRLSLPQVKMAFMDSQPADSLGAAQSSGTDSMAVLDFDEFLEAQARSETHGERAGGAGGREGGRRRAGAAGGAVRRVRR